MKGKLIWSIFWALVGVFVLALSGIFVMGQILRSPLFFFVPWALLLLLGVAFIVLTVREKVGGMLKKFFLLTGASAVGLPVFAVLHNAVYALFIYFFGEGFWNSIGGDEPVFFMLAVFVCPIAFLVGAIGSIVLFNKKPWLVEKSPPRRRKR